jgi:hypothetical protein
MTVSKLKNGKATGHVQTLAKLIKKGGKELKMVTCKLILKIWRKRSDEYEKGVTRKVQVLSMSQ